MDLSEKELEERLFEGGNKLLSPPSSIPELLASLDLVEHLLGGVEQSPSESMKQALVPSTKALVAEELLRHSNPDVKVAVASCISEITRITAPEAPYDDDQMKELFQLIVSSFEKLDDKSSSSYKRRVSILETVAKVRSCVVMLDLECDELIVEMFRHFFKTIRDDHDDRVVSSMETIMTLVVEESEDISVDLLSPILNVLKKENKEILPIACQLGEKVIVDCAAKLKPYLLPAVRLNGTSLDDYSKVVSDACQAGDEAVEPSDGDATDKNVADENNMVNTPSETAVEVAMETMEDAPSSEEVANTVGLPKTVMSNGILEKGNDNTSVANDNSKKAFLEIQDDKAEPNETIADSVSSEDPSKTQPEKSNNTSESIDNSKEADLDTQDEKSEPSETVADGIGSEEPPKSETKPEKSNNTSEVNDNSMEVGLDTQDDKLEPSETIADSVSSEEPPRSQIMPDNSKEAELDTQTEKAEPSETVSDSVGSEELPKSKSKPQKSNSYSAPDDNSKEADLDKQDDRAEPSEMIVDKQDEKAEPSDMIVDKKNVKAEPSETIVASVGSEESPKSNTKPEKSNSNCVANDDLKEADLDTQDEKAETSEMIVDSVASEEPPKSKTKPGKSKKQRGKRSKSKKKSRKPPVSDRIMEVVDSSEHQDNTKNVANNAIQSEDPVVQPTEAADNEKLSKALISSPKTSDNERVDISSPSLSESLADETRSKKAGAGKKIEGMIKDGEKVSNVDAKESDSESEKESTGPERNLNKGGNKKPSSESDNEESAPDATDDMKEEDSIDDLDGSPAQDLAQKTKVGGGQRTKTKKQGQVKPAPAKSRRKTPAKDEREKTAGPPKSNTKAARDESDVKEALKSSSKRKRPSGKNVPKNKVYREDLIGARVEVWWPEDEAFYKGVVSAFDPAEKKHTVSYDDNEIEILNLKEEEWQLISLSEEHANDGDGPDESDDETPIGKKVKTDLEAKRGKTVSSSKKSGASSSKSKATPKSGSKQAISKVYGKSKEEDMAGKSAKASKLGNRLVDDDTKSAKKSKVDDTNTPKVSSKSKQDISKVASKSKGKPSKSVGKSSSAAGGKVKVATPTNSVESEDESPEPERAPVKSKGKSQSTPKGKTPKSVGKSSSAASGKAKPAAPTNSDESEDESPEPERAPVKSKGKSQSTPKSQNSSKKRKRSGKI